MSRRRATLGRVLSNTRLRAVALAFLGFGAAEYGVWLAVLVYAYERGGATRAGVIAVVQLIPAAVVAPLAPRFAARLSAGASLYLGYVALAATLAITAALLLVGAPELLVYGGAVLAASAVTLIRPAQSALLPELVSSPADLTAANAITGWVESVSVLIGPALAGAMIGLDGPGAATALLAAAVLGGVVLVSPLRTSGTTADDAPAESDPLTDAGGVLSAVRRKPAIGLLLALVAIEFIAIGALDVLEIVLAVRVLAIGAGDVGYLAAAFGAGGVLGSVATVGLVGRRVLAGAALAGASVSGAAFVVLGIWPTVAGALVLLAAFGVGRSFLDVAARTILHRVVPSALRRHVFGAQEGLSMLGLAAGSIAVPALIAAGSAKTALIGTGALLLATALIVGPSLRAIERSAPAPRAQLAALAHSPLFSMLAAPVLEDLSRGLTELSVGAGAVVIREGDIGDRYYLVRDGELDVTVGGRYIRTITRGDGFGEIALLRDGIRTATVTARVPSQLYALARTPFLEALTGSEHAQRVAQDVVVDRLSTAASER